jgi:hypothetical protein
MDFGHGHGGGRGVIEAGRDEVERGRNRLGKPTATSATGRNQDRDQRGVGDGTGAVPGHDPNAQATAASAADPTSEKGRGNATDTRYPANSGTAGTAANGTHGLSPEQYHDEKTTATAPPRDPHGAADSDDGSGVQTDTDVRQHGDGIAPSDRGNET